MKKLMYHLEYILLLPLAVMSILSAINENIVLLSVGICFFIETISYLFLVFNNKILKYSAGIIKFINGAISTVALLLLAISMLNNTAPLYYVIYALFYLSFKIFTFFFYLHYKDDLYSIIYKELSINMIMQIINLLACIIFYNFDKEENLTYMIDVLTRVVKDNYKGYDTLKFYLLVIKIVINFITSQFIAYYTASAMILILKDQKLSLKEKIKSIVDFIQKYNIGFVMGETFSTIIFINYLLKSNENEQFRYIAFFYLLIIILRAFLFIMNFIFKKKYKDDNNKFHRKKYLLLIITSAAFILFNQILNGALLTISAQNNNPNAFPIWWLVLIILPFSSYGFVLSLLSYRRARISKDAYLLSCSLLSFISSLFMLFGSIVYILAKLSETFTVIIWFILISIVIGLELFISIYSLVIGIKGLKRKEIIQENID